MKKIELLNLNKALQGLVTPSMSPERGVIWLKGVMAIKRASDLIQEDIQAAVAMTNKTNEEKNELINHLVSEDAVCEIFHADQDEVMQVMAANPDKTMGERIFIIDTLS